jgi:hypothetical protein
MKFLATLLSVYILIALTSSCCCDYLVSDSGSQTEQHEAGHLPQDNCHGVCSPFCLCAACAGFTVELVFPHNQIKPEEISSELSVYPQQICTLPSLTGIWQPPQGIKI